MEILLNVQDQAYHLSLDKNRIWIPTGLSVSSALLYEVPRRPYQLKFIPPQRKPCLIEYASPFSLLPTYPR